MPYEIGSDSSCPDGKPFAVKNAQTGDVKGCHATRADAEAQLKALYANEPGLAADEALGGDPNPGTKPDKRLKANRRSTGLDETADLDAIEAEIAGQPLGTPFSILLCVEGIESGESSVIRTFELGTTDWRPLPIPFMVQDTTPHGPGQVPQPAWAAGQIEHIERDPADPSRIIGRGRLLANESGQRAEQLARGAFRGVSIDGYPRPGTQDAVQPTHIDADGDPVGVLLRYAGTTIARVTMVPTAALVPCCIWFDDEEMPEATAAAHGGYIPEDTPPVVVASPTNKFEALVAAANSPTLLNPPREWFFTPEPDRYQPIEVSADGHWTGHIAAKGQCYLGTGDRGVRCETAPPSKTTPPYKSFHRTLAECDDGSKVACGWVTMGTKHANRSTSLRPGEVADQYDHTGTIGARIRCSNGRYGIWSSGALMPGLEDRELAILQGPQVSGDWRTWHDPETSRRFALELIGVLGVPVPAFPGSRPEVLVASAGVAAELGVPEGSVVAQIGQLTPCDGEDVPMTPDELAHMQALEAKVDRQERIITVLAAAAGVDIAAAGSMMTCPDCGAKVPEGTDTCPECGADLSGGMSTAAEGTISTAAGTEIAFDASAPLTAGELAAWSLKYDGKTKGKMAKDGRALYDGSFAIGDADDLRLAIRAGAPHDHLARNAALLGLPELVPAPAEA